MPVAIALGLLLVLVFAFAHRAAAQSASAQSNVNPLTFGNNFFVTGDYVVAGAYGLGANAPAVNGFATGTINVPDKDPVTGKMNPGITGVTSVPAGAEIVAALLYWQTVEKSTQLGTGQNGFFRPVFAGGPQSGYPISGTTASQNTVSFSGGGCTGSSGGKVVRTYRASVRGLLPQDANGNVLANSTYEVRLANNPNAGLPTLGATLVIIYRVVSPNVPLNSIVIYDGSFAPGNNLYTMTQTVQGFYDAAHDPASRVSRLTHIVGSGHNYKFQTVYLGTPSTPLTPLPNLYASGQPFPGYYGSWDNTTWTFDSNKTYVTVPNPVNAGDAQATTKVVPSMSQGGCVSWGAVIVSTTVQNTDGDGLLDVWKTNQGYCDASINGGSCTSGNPSTGWVDLTGAGKPGSGQDVFVQLDYMCSVLNSDGTCATNIPFCSTLDMNGNCNTPVYSFDPHLTVDPLDGKNVVDKVVAAFASSPNPIHLHVIPTNAIQEQTCVDNSNNPVCASITTNGLTPFPNQPGVVGWKGGLIFLKNQLFDADQPTNLTDCATSPLPAGEDCKPRFQHGRKDSYHYALFAHALGLPNWTLVTGTLTSVAQSGTTVTFTTSTPHGLIVDSKLGNGRVTIANAITNPNLNGTQLVTGVSPTGVLTITQTIMSATGVATYTFTQSSGTAPAAGDFVTVKNTTNGNGVFNVVNAQIVNVSGSTFTVNGFPQSAIAVQDETGDVPSASAQTARPPFTFTIDLGTSVSSAPSYTLMTDPYLIVASGQADEVSGFSDVGGQDSVIALGSWLANGVTWQVKAGTLMHELGHSLGLTHGGFYFDSLTANNNNYTPTIEANCKSNHQSVMNYMFQVDLLDNGTGFNVLDYSGQTLSALDESAPTSNPLVSPTYKSTSWYFPTVVGTPATEHCDGTPILDRARMSRTTGLTGSLSWATGQDINFDGVIETITNTAPVTYGLRGHNDWASIDPRQIGATGSLSVLGSGGLAGGSGGLAGGSGGLAGGSGGLAGGSGGLAGGSGGLAGGSGGLAGGSGGKHGELTRRTANSVTRPPRKLTATEDASSRHTHLFFFPPTFGQIGSFNIYRQPPWVPGNSPTFSVPIGGLTFHSDPALPHFGEYEFVDTTVICNPSGYTYFVTAVLGAGSTNPGQESAPSNTVSTGQNGELLTGCYTFTGFSSPAAGSSAVRGTLVPITWSVQDLSNKSGAFVNNTGANTLVAIGPINNDALCVTPTVNTPRTTIAQSGAGISVSSGPNYVFTFNWNTTAFAAGCYLLELDLDSGQPKAGNQSAFQVLIYLSDVSLLVTTPSPLPAATETVAYNTQLTESGGTTGGPALFSWTVVAGSLPNGMVLGVAPDGVSGALTGTPTTPGTYNFTVKVTDSIGDFGTQPLTLLVNALVSTTADSGAGSLRQAILDVNAAQPGPQPLSILFKIPSAGVQTISPITPLPALTQPTILDATTQTGYTGTPLIELNGTNAGNPANGLDVAGGSSTVAGLVINRFNGNGIQIDTKGGDVIQANYIGTDKTGATAAPNTGNGIQIIAVPNNTVGGAASAMRNIISGNTGEGVRIDGTLATGNIVRGNYIGTDMTGSNAVGNTLSGVYIRHAPSNSVIGNVISGNIGFAGITICGFTGVPACGGGDVGVIDETSNASGNTIQGNLVGTNALGTAALGNSNAGLSIDGAPNTVVGGTAAGAANTISFNGTIDVQIFDAGASGNQIKGNAIQGTGANNDVGISVGVLSGTTLTGNTLTGNAISGHAGLGIDLNPSGVNPNTTGGANNYPVISSAQASSGMVMGTLNGPAAIATFTIEFFSNSACNAPNGNGEGAVFLGSTTVMTDSSGNVVFAAPVAGLVAGKTITATSTDANGTTSEFSACVPVS
jgi:hypothetical protein